ncbi:MAG: DNA repair protein RecO [Oscillospiraceae bacterium]
MQITTDAIVLKEYTLDEESRIVTLLTKDRGIVSAYIRGAKRLRSSLTSSTQLFCYSHFVLFKHKNKYSVNSADVNAEFYEITKELETFTLATYLAQLMTELAPEEENTSEYLRLMLNSLYMLKENKRELLFIKPMFELRLLSMAGYMPDLIACEACGIGSDTDTEMLFLPRQGVLLCSKCAVNNPNEVKFVVSESILSAMRYIIYSPMEKLFNFSLSGEGFKYLNRITETYMLTQISKSFTALEMFRSLIANDL